MDQNDREKAPAQAEPPDTGLKQLMTYTFIALVVAVAAALVAMGLAVYFFDR